MGRKWKKPFTQEDAQMQLHIRREALPPSGSECVRAQFCWTLGDPMVYSRQAPQSKNFPGKNTGVGCHSLLQRIFLTLT